MPKLKESDEQVKNRLTRAYIAKGIELSGKTEEQLAIHICCTKRTLQNKRKNPGTFTLKELRIICAILKLSEQEKAQIL